MAFGADPDYLGGDMESPQLIMKRVGRCDAFRIVLGSTQYDRQKESTYGNALCSVRDEMAALVRW